MLRHLASVVRWYACKSPWNLTAAAEQLAPEFWGPSPGGEANGKVRMLVKRLCARFRVARSSGDLGAVANTKPYWGDFPNHVVGLWGSVNVCNSSRLLLEWLCASTPLYGVYISPVQRPMRRFGDSQRSRLHQLHTTALPPDAARLNTVARER